MKFMCRENVIKESDSHHSFYDQSIAWANVKNCSLPFHPFPQLPFLLRGDVAAVS